MREGTAWGISRIAFPKVKFYELRTIIFALPRFLILGRAVHFEYDGDRLRMMLLALETQRFCGASVWFGRVSFIILIVGGFLVTYCDPSLCRGGIILSKRI